MAIAAADEGDMESRGGEGKMGGVVIPLDGPGWTVHNGNGSVSVNGWVPGQVHMFLLLDNVIADPYYGFNDVNVRRSREG